MPELQDKTNVAAAEDEDRNPTPTKKREEATEEDDHSTLKEESVGDEQQQDEEGKRPTRRQREPIVLGRGVTGTVKWFSMTKGLLYIEYFNKCLIKTLGYGFIRIDDSEEEVRFGDI
jgi:cold shock CspA family protein